MEYQDILYNEADGVATITIDRPEKMNAFRGQTCEELIHAFNRAGWNKDIGVIVLTGAGDRAFCTGGDQSAHEGPYDGRGTIGLPVEELQSVIRDVPKPVIARVQGYAIGGGNVLAVICDLTIAADTAQFGQVGPKVGSVDPGFGTAYLAQVVGEKRLVRSGIYVGAIRGNRQLRWDWQTRSFRLMSWMRKWTGGVPKSLSVVPRPSPLPSGRSTRRRRTCAASRQWVCRR